MADILTPAQDRPGLLSRAVKSFIVWLFRATGWRAAGTLPEGRKFILAGANHTSNWDFVVFLGVVNAMGVRPRYMGKHTLFRWPMRRFMLDMGGIPVNRGKKSDMVRQVADRIDAEDEFALVVAIEGTRSATTEWKSGFYRIAMAADIPIVCVGPDYGRKLGIIGPVIHPTGDYNEDMKVAIDFFKQLQPANPEKAVFPDGSGIGDTRLDLTGYPIREA